MDLIFCLHQIVTEFRPLFNQQSFELFCAFIEGLIIGHSPQTVTSIYQASRPNVRYWSMVKFLSRSKWSADAVAKCLLRVLQQTFDNWVYVYDETKAIKTGRH